MKLLIFYEIKVKSEMGKLGVAIIKKRERTKKGGEMSKEKENKGTKRKMKNVKAVIVKVKMLLNIGVIDKMHLLFIWIMLYSWSLHKSFIGNGMTDPQCQHG